MYDDNPASPWSAAGQSGPLQPVPPRPAPVMPQLVSTPQPGWNQPGWAQSVVTHPVTGQQPFTGAQPVTGQQPVAPQWYAGPQSVMVPWQVPPPAPGRRYGLGVVVTVGIVAAVLAGAVGVFAGAALKPAGGHPVAAAAAGTPGETSTPGTSTPDGSTLAAGKALLAQVAEPPDSATAVPVIGSTGGVMDIDQFVAKFFAKHPDAAKAALSNDNFKVAAQRNWMGSDGVEVEDQLVEFASEADAQRYVTSQNRAFQADEDIVARFEIPNVALGNGYERKSLDSAGNRRATLIAVDGFYAVVLFFHTPHDFDRTAEIAAMQAQLDKIQ